MAGKKRKKNPLGPLAAQNRKAYHDYFIDEKIEAGIVLVGSEVKALRAGRANISDAYAAERGDELWLQNAHISEYGAANRANHEPKRTRKLLLHRREIARLIGAINRKGMTLVPLAIYFNARGMAKVTLGLARGKHSYDKRQSTKDQEWKRQQGRLLREKG